MVVGLITETETVERELLASDARLIRDEGNVYRRPLIRLPGVVYAGGITKGGGSHSVAYVKAYVGVRCTPITGRQARVRPAIYTDRRHDHDPGRICRSIA